MNNLLYLKIKELKKQYINDGFVIIGIFGSYARNEETDKSDVDILYELTDGFMNRFKGFSAFYRLESIRNELVKSLGKEVDITDKEALGEMGKKYILGETLYVN